MFVSTDAAALLRVALELVAAAEEEDLPQLRVGLAAGSAVRRAGDWFGSPVNVASRVTAVARPGAVLVTNRRAVKSAISMTSPGHSPARDTSKVYTTRSSCSGHAGQPATRKSTSASASGLDRNGE